MSFGSTRILGQPAPFAQGIGARVAMGDVATVIYNARSDGATFAFPSGVALIASVDIAYDDGTLDRFEVRIDSWTANMTTVTRFEGTNNAALGSSRPVTRAGTVIGGFVSGVLTDVVRTQLYVRFGFTRKLDGPFFPIARDYAYDSHPFLVGEFVESTEGKGHFRWKAAFAADRAGNAAAVDVSLAAVNTLRKVHGLVWYYNASADVATRTFDTPRISGLGGTKPTGFTLTGDNAVIGLYSGNIALTASEEGMYYASPVTLRRNDNGTLTTENITTSPSPFPFDVTESDTDSIIRFPAITTGNANDVHSAYILIEEWVEAP